MRPLREWSLTRVVLTSAGWVVGVLLITVFWLLWYFRPTIEAADAGGGSGGIGAVSFGINVFLLLIPAGPPIALFITWLIVRWRR